VVETAYLAHPDFVGELAAELGDLTERHGRLLLAPGPAREVAWAQNVWFEPVRLPIASIAEGARALRAVQRNWVAYLPEHAARGRLLAERLPPVSGRPLVFGQPRPSAPLGSWTLRDRGTLLYAARCSSAFPNGEVRFVEDRRAPPNRAYLKLWEALTLLDERPGPGQVCLDLGSAPGGWTWALAGLGARVISVDKAPLDDLVAAMPGVEYRRESAFGLDPAGLGPIDWLFCDVACYPERLLALVTRWLEAGTCSRFVCTIKLQGVPRADVLRDFASLPGARLRHLWHNKHELTWFRLP
jgi:23S rRNA (cytidine2498-2'-O)-methyltransferase